MLRQGMQCLQGAECSPVVGHAVPSCMYITVQTCGLGCIRKGLYDSRMEWKG